MTVHMTYIYRPHGPRVESAHTAHMAYNCIVFGSRITTTTEATTLSDIGPSWCVVALQHTRQPMCRWDWSLDDPDRNAFATLKKAGKIITVIGRSDNGDLRLYAKLAAYLHPRAAMRT